MMKNIFEIHCQLLSQDIDGTKIYTINCSDVCLFIINRTDIQTFKKEDLFNRSGSYILSSGVYMDNRRKVYIGQTHNLIERLIQHDAHKEYWTYAMCFTTDDVLDKTDTAYLEYLFIKEFIECGCIGLLQNYQVPVEPIIKESSKEILMEKFRYMKLLLEFSGFRLLSNKVLEVGDISQKNSRRLMDRIVRSYSKMNNNDITDEDEHDECEKFVLNGEDFHAEVITLKDGRYMVLPFGFISKWASLDYIEKEFGENVVDKKTRKLKKEIILDNLNNLGTIITGFYVNPENIKKVVGH